MAGPGRRGKGDTEARQARLGKALELRIAGGTYRQIGEQLGVTAPQAYQDVQHALGALDAERAKLAERYRDLEIERCDKLQVVLGRKAATGDERACLTLVRVMERRAKLLGLDQTPPQTVTLALSTDLAARLDRGRTRNATRESGDD